MRHSELVILYGEFCACRLPLRAYSAAVSESAEWIEIRNIIASFGADSLGLSCRVELFNRCVFTPWHDVTPWEEIILNQLITWGY